MRRAVRRASFCAGALFAFANPPLQTPDETDHYLRTYAISLGRFDFDYARTYPEDVARLVEAFPGAWVNAHTSAGMGEDPDTGEETPYNTAGYALKQYGKDGRIQSIADSFAAYLGKTGEDPAPLHEPVSFLVLPFAPGALGMAMARLLGFGALGCLYAGRLGNLLAYAALCRAALRSAQKYRPAFLAFMLLPLSLFMGASLSYDATLLGCYYLMLALLTRERWKPRTAAVYAAACVFVNIAKPYLNLLWVLLPLALLSARAWQAKGRRWLWTAGMGAGALAATLLVEAYGRLARHNYPVIARQGGQAVDGMQQLLFVLRNPLRTIATFWGTLYENEFFLGQLGVFGWKDLPVPLLNLLGPCVLGAALCLWRGRDARPRPPPRAGPGRVCRRLRGGRYGRHVYHLHAGGHGAHRRVAGAVFPAGVSGAGPCGRRAAAPRAGPVCRRFPGRAPGCAAVRRPRAAGRGAAVPALFCGAVLHDPGLMRFLSACGKARKEPFMPILPLLAGLLALAFLACAAWRFLPARAMTPRCCRCPFCAAR